MFGELIENEVFTLLISMAVGLGITFFVILPLAAVLSGINRGDDDNGYY